MNLNLDLISEYDGLLLIHPDFFPYKPTVTHENVEKVHENFRLAQDYCLNHSIPFMLVKAFEDYDNNHSSLHGLKLKKGFHIMYRINYVKEISRIVGKPETEISILFGGFKFDACVRNFVANICEHIEFSEEYPGPASKWLNNNQFFKESERLKKGRIFFELTDYIIR